LLRTSREGASPHHGGHEKRSWRWSASGSSSVSRHRTRVLRSRMEKKRALCLALIQGLRDVVESFRNLSYSAKNSNSRFMVIDAIFHPLASRTSRPGTTSNK